MANFNKCIPVVLKFEGGLSDDPDDRGGITKYGVSLNFAKGTNDLSIFDKTGDEQITSEDIRKLTIDDAKLAYKRYFWDKFWLDKITSDKKALVVFDASVNHGVKSATALLQKSLNSIGCNLVIDGVYGSKTFAAFQDADEMKIIDAFNDYREKLYRKIVANNASQSKFLRGWLNRITKLDNEVSKLC